MSHAAQDALPIKLRDDHLAHLPESILCPDYDRTALTPGIVHIGVGNFHRAHQAWFLHRLMQQGQALDWAIIGAGVRSYDAEMRERLLQQDCLTTLIELDPAGTSAEIVGSMIDYVPVEPGNQALIDRMSDPAIRIVAMTVTESGYYSDPVTKQFDDQHSDIQHDAANPDSPRTAFGAMVASLRRRRANGTGPFTALSCDNLLGNGHILHQTLVSLARLSDPDLADWIDANCSFPNSMVDCIVPATGPNEIALARQVGIEDLAPVTHENFRQWVIEDDFCAGRPEWERVGATLTDDVHAFESMKLHILNAGHQVLANPGEILSVETIADCMAHPLILAMFQKVQSEEIVPHVHAVPGFSASAYLELIERRFSNPAIVDTTRRVAFDGFARHTGFVLPIIRSAIASDAPVEGLALVEAMWARMCHGTREDGTTIAPNDPMWDALVIAATAARDRPRVWIEQREIYGGLCDTPRFADAFARWLDLIWTNGCSAALRVYTT